MRELSEEEPPMMRRFHLLDGIRAMDGAQLLHLLVTETGRRRAEGVQNSICRQLRNVILAAAIRARRRLQALHSRHTTRQFLCCIASVVVERPIRECPSI